MASLLRVLAVLLLLGGIGLLAHREMNANAGDDDDGLPIAREVPLAKVDIDVSKLPGPRKEYTAEQVVKILMDALQNNDEKDAGIATVFNFASPGNKKFTGPLERFIPMVKSAAYRPMLNFKSAEYGEMTTKDDHAEQSVTLTTTEGDVAVYLFQLSKQSDGDVKDCWMTDGVVRVPPKGKPA